MSSTNETTSQPQGSAVPSANHQNTSNMTSASVAQANVGGESYRCEWNSNDPARACNERLPTPEALYDHVCERHVGRKSTNNLNLTCAWGPCHTTTVKRDHITSHIRVHVPLKPHKCDFCQKAFKRPQDLKKHVKTHAEDTSNYQSAPEASRSGGGPGGVFQGQPKHVADLQHLAATASGYYPEHSHAMHGQAPGYGHYANGNPNPSSYHGPSSGGYQAVGFGTTYYSLPAQALNTEYELRKKATFDALNEFFGDLKARNLDPRVYEAVGQRLMNLHNLPNCVGSTEYAAGPAVATASHVPLTNHYTLPLANLRTKADLQDIDQFLEQLQATVYEHETATQAAAAGVPRSGHAVYSASQGYGRSSHSPPHLHASSHAQGQSLPPLTTATETPALTPASSVISYNSPGPVHSAALSPVPRGSMGNPYPTLPAVSSMPDATHGYTSTSSAVPSALATSFDADGRRRFSGGILQKYRIESTSPDILPRIEKLGVRSPILSNVDPALYSADQTTPRAHSAQSPIDPALTESDSKEPAPVDFAVISRVLETIKGFIKHHLDNQLYEHGDHDEARSFKNEPDIDQDARSLYPVLRHVQDE